LTIVGLLLALVFATGGVTASAAPVVAPDSVTQATDAPAADRYLAAAFSPSTRGWALRWSSSLDSATSGSLDNCNLNQSDGAYDCVYAGYTLNGWLALADSENGSWAYSAGASATYAGKNALAWCNYYQGKNCYIVFNRHAHEK
jgi:hypothetical protein